ncbi:amidase domain-containing protein [Clostridium tyrobutyricum]|uniref:amidase domain-containing protein n=1 Tax=Clostridium tyrobutyricum TaxID=1519 RepID=UPI0005808D41|nr:amidase domain-containing protein [Clostridium tyrobutyricum]MEA5007441.1 amidase domain-containing protein [Clostridium tyrobutyricum]
MNYINSTSYSRVNAVNYAFKYALEPNPNYKYFLVYSTNGGDCTNFISQCLRAGGAPIVTSGRNQWWYNNRGWSVSWSTAGSLYWYLKINDKDKLYGIKGTEVNSISMMEPGDIIFYQNANGRMQHSAIITSYYENYPLVSQHTPNVLNIPYKKDWAVKMHFLKIHL